MATTWDTTAKNANIVLSNGNLTAADNGTTLINFAGRSNTSISGKKYWEVTITTGPVGSMGVGVANSSKTWADNEYLGLDLNAVGYYGDTNVFRNDISVLTLASFGDGDKICVAVDTVNSKIWWRVNGGSWNNTTDNPATNTGGLDISTMGTVFPGYNLLHNAEAGLLTGNFGASGFSFTPPAGFSAFDDFLMGQVMM